MSNIVRLGIVKAGCLGSLPLLEFLLDERAEREDLEIKVVSTGAKVTKNQCAEAAMWMVEKKPDLIILVGPAQPTPGPTEARKILANSEIPTIIISDAPMRRITAEIEEAGMGWIVVEADSMIGARREYLDPTEMALFNADVIRVLACTGVLSRIRRTLDAVIDEVKRGKEPTLPKLIIDKENAIAAAGFSNPYALAKARAAHEISQRVAGLNIEACFKVAEWEKYTSIAASGHEMMRYAAILADEARELDKTADSVLREPHFDDGTLGVKRRLIEKPSRV